MTCTKLCDGSFIRYFENILNEEEINFYNILNLMPKTKPSVLLFGKRVETPRYYTNYGFDYKFANSKNDTDNIIPKVFLPFIKIVKKNEGEGNYGVLVNWYPDGNHYIGYHSDDTSQLEPKSNIYCFSLGASRDFCLKSKADKSVTKFILKNNSLLVMVGDTQNTHKHSLPKRTKCNELRISITIRKFSK